MHNPYADLAVKIRNGDPLTSEERELAASALEGYYEKPKKKQRGGGQPRADDLQEWIASFSFGIQHVEGVPATKAAEHTRYYFGLKSIQTVWNARRRFPHVAEQLKLAKAERDAIIAAKCKGEDSA